MKNKVLKAAMLGNALEHYDFMLYNFFMSILSPLYFPHEDPMVSLLSGWGVFALSFFARPLGAIFFGHIGDQKGRRQALSSSILLMAFSTFSMGVLPDYHSMGITASILFVCLRFLQGFSSGGEVSGASIYAIEHTTKNKHGFTSSLIFSSAGMGTIVATLMGAFFTASFVPFWGWRIPFLLGGLTAFIGYYYRKNLDESIEYTNSDKKTSLPLKEIFTSHRPSFYRAFGVGAFIYVPIYMIVGYMNPLLHTQGLISSPQMMLINGGITLIGVPLYPLVGYLADKYSISLLMRGACIGFGLAIIPAMMIFESGNLTAIIFMQFMLRLIMKAYLAPSSAYVNNLFPPTMRYSGVAFSMTLGVGLFGGLTPLVCIFLSQHVGPVIGPGIFAIIAAFVGFLSIRFQK